MGSPNDQSGCHASLLGCPKIHKSSIMLQRRSRVKVKGVVMPSPVGPAIENDA
jgi:hypothetical protein